MTVKDKEKLEILTQIAKEIIAQNPKQNIYWDYVAPEQSIATLDEFDVSSIASLENVEDAMALIRALTKLATYNEFDNIEFEEQMCGWVILPKDWDKLFVCTNHEHYMKEPTCMPGCHIEYIGKRKDSE